MTDRLPLEVFRRIIEHLQPLTDNAALAALSQTSRFLQPIAERILYHTLYLVGAQSVSNIVASCTSRPALLANLRHLYIQPSERRTSRHYWTQVTQILSIASAHMELLCISTPETEAAYATWALQSLHEAEHLGVVRVPFWWGNEIVDFLESEGARSLTRLETGDTFPANSFHAIVEDDEEQQQQQQPAPLTLHPNAVPYLRIVDAPPNALCLLIPGRAVTHVKMRVGPTTTLQTLPPADFLVGQCLVRSVAPSGVIALDVGDLTHSHHNETYSLEVMELAPRFLPRLRFLGRVNFPWGKDVLPSRMYRPLLQLPELDTLELVVTHMRPQVDMYWELATASELRTFSTSLRQIVFFQGGSDIHRWVWVEQEGDFVLASHNERYLPWGGL